MTKSIKTALAIMAGVGIGMQADVTKPSWADNQLGMEALDPNYTDSGVTPFKVFKNLILCWQKKQVFGQYALPDLIGYRDDKILDKPARLEMTTAQGPVTFPKASCNVEQQGKTQMLATSAFEAAGLNFSIQGQLEFDFTTKYTITIAPQKDPVKVKSLSLVFPLGTKADKEKLVMYQTEGPDKPEPGVDAQKRRVHKTIKGGDRALVSPGFCALIWVGTTEWGLSWNFESARNWEPVKGKELTYDPVSGEFRLNFIGRDFAIDKPLTYCFYLTPTPIRAMPKNWRAWNYGWRGDVAQNFNSLPVNQLLYWSSLYRSVHFNCQWIRNAKGIQEAVKKDGTMHKGNYYIPQLVTTASAWEDEEGNVFYREDPYLDKLCQKYQRQPSQPAKKLDIPDDAIRINSNDDYDRLIGKTPQEITKKFGPNWNGDNRNYDVIFAPPLADYMVAGLAEFIKLGAGGIYYDGINPCLNYADWAAWTDSEGKKRPTFHYEWQRQLLKRMRALVKKNNPNEVIIAHQSGTRPVSTLSLCDAILPGETFYYWYHDPDVRDASPTGEFYYAYIVGDIDNLKGEFFHRQWGVPHILLPEIRGKNGLIFKNPRGTRTMLSFTLHFDMLYFPTMCQVGEIYKIYKIRNQYGMADTNEYVVEFTPYWENELFKADDEDIKISYYDHEKQQELYTSFDITKDFMVIVSNLQFVDRDYTVTLPTELKKAKVVEMQSGRSLEVKDGKIKDQLEAYGFAIYRVTGEMDRNGNW